MTRQGIENLGVLAAAARYNTERRPILRGYFDTALQSGQIFSTEIVDEAVSDYSKDQDIDPRNPEDAFRQLLLMYPDDAEPQHYQIYLSVRFGDMSEQIRSNQAYSAVDLISFEAFIRNLVSDRAEQLGISSKYYTYSDKEELVQVDEFERPSVIFQNKWISCIEFSRSTLIDSFLAETEDQQLAQEQSVANRIDAVNSMINFLSKSYDENEQYSSYQFLDTPLFEVPGKENRILVPFPSLLVNTAHIRIENIFQNDEGLRKTEDSEKGELVEELTMDALSEFESRNLIRSFKYTDPHPRETDGLLLFEDSFWTVEVKSHPIFRKVPNDLSIAIDRFESKAKSAIEQGQNTIEFLREQGSDILYNLTGEKSTENKEYGTIVVLDGLLPTLFSQNRRVDQLFGTSSIYDSVEEHDRVYLITLFDLFELTNQVDELDRLEDFLLWRTDFGFNMPVFSFNEREYWAMYFDNYEPDKEFQETIDDAAERDILVTYISERFNDKPYLPKDRF
ncbi:hypothetical protein [Haloarchaeobius sp. HRN-SO-5]|uniref:hypothetical protein n=1 Tax=Haloarchaeobius sp. HRN-SO-5 TaxID=3446118 RepID=UPI003EBECB70